MSDTDTLRVEFEALRTLIVEWRKADQKALELQSDANRFQLDVIRTEYRSLSRLVYIGLGIVITVNFFADLAVAVYVGLHK